MRFPPSILEEIKARLPVSAVVGRRVRLQKAGREWKGLSPFNAEKTPSFFVNDQKQRFFDFSSGKNGDIFSFVMETEGLSFNEAVERLASEAGVPLPKLSREAVEQEERRRSLYDVVELAAQYFEVTLAGKEGAKARAYLDGRGLGAETRKRFRIGYATRERFGLRDVLAAKGVSRDDMIATGLLISGEDIEVPYDRFHDRVMFPIADLKGRVIAFGGRALASEAAAKYLNSPETPLFHKGSVLYNHHNARKAAHELGHVIAVEGYVDVIAMVTAGFPASVAPLGTALTEDQLGLLWRMADEPVLCFDGDGAGRRAAYRAIDVALPLLQPGKSLRFALLPEGQDPDDLARAGGHPAIEAVIGGAKPLVDLLWAREADAAPLDTPERRAALERRLREIAGQIRDETLRRHYLAEIQRRLAAFLPLPSGPRAQGQWAKRKQEQATGPRAQMAAQSRNGGTRPTRNAQARREALIVLGLMAHPHLLAAHCDALAHLDFLAPEARELAQALVDCTAGHEGDDSDAVVKAAQQGRFDAMERLKGMVDPFERWVLAPEANPQDADDMLRQAMALHHRFVTLNTQLREAERALAEDMSEANLAWLKDVRSELSSLTGAEADIDGFGGGGRVAARRF
jgi:DNA primase